MLQFKEQSWISAPWEDSKCTGVRIIIAQLIGVSKASTTVIRVNVLATKCNIQDSSFSIKQT